MARHDLMQHTQHDMTRHGAARHKATASSTRWHRCSPRSLFALRLSGPAPAMRASSGSARVRPGCASGPAGGRGGVGPPGWTLARRTGPPVCRGLPRGGRGCAPRHERPARRWGAVPACRDRGVQNPERLPGRGLSWPRPTAMTSSCGGCERAASTCDARRQLSSLLSSYGDTMTHTSGCCSAQDTEVTARSP